MTIIKHCAKITCNIIENMKGDIRIMTFMMKDTLQSEILAQDPERYIGPDFSGLNEFPVGFNTNEFLPESSDEFSSSPFEFCESSKMLWEDTRLIYQHACLANRFTEEYLKLCGKLEKNIKQVGSLCITKAVLEQKGLSFPELAGMEIEGLIGMVSYHLRKCHAAFRSIYRHSNFLGMSYLNWEFRWVDLGNRLKSTDVRIRNILDGKENVDKVLARENICSRDRQRNETGFTAGKTGLPVNPAAMPINGSLVRELLQRRKEAEKKDRQKQKMLDELYQIWGKKNDFSSGLKGSYEDGKNTGSGSILNQVVQQKKDSQQMMHGFLSGLRTCFPNPEPGKAADFITAEEARKILIRDAENRGDLETAEIINREDENTLQYRWMNFIEDPPDDG